jgi:signal transduction histidine kinase
VFADEGPGLPEAQLKRIFDRFVRYDPTSGRNRGTGHGLGLAICKSIVDLHTGTIRARNRTDHTGLEIVVEFPNLAPKSPGAGGLMIKETLTPWG